MDSKGGGEDEGGEGGSVGLLGQGQDPPEKRSYLSWIDFARP